MDGCLAFQEKQSKRIKKKRKSFLLFNKKGKKHFCEILLYPKASVPPFLLPLLSPSPSSSPSSLTSLKISFLTSLTP